MIVVDTEKYMKPILIYINEVHFCKKLYNDNTLLDHSKKICAPNPKYKLQQYG